MVAAEDFQLPDEPQEVEGFPMLVDIREVLKGDDEALWGSLVMSKCDELEEFLIRGGVSALMKDREENERFVSLKDELDAKVSESSKLTVEASIYQAIQYLDKEVSRLRSRLSDFVFKKEGEALIHVSIFSDSEFEGVRKAIKYVQEKLMNHGVISNADIADANIKHGAFEALKERFDLAGDERTIFDSSMILELGAEAEMMMCYLLVMEHFKDRMERYLKVQAARDSYEEFSPDEDLVGFIQSVGMALEILVNNKIFSPEIYRDLHRKTLRGINGIIGSIRKKGDYIRAARVIESVREELQEIINSYFRKEGRYGCRHLFQTRDDFADIVIETGISLDLDPGGAEKSERAGYERAYLEYGINSDEAHRALEQVLAGELMILLRMFKSISSLAGILRVKKVKKEQELAAKQARRAAWGREVVTGKGNLIVFLVPGGDKYSLKDAEGVKTALEDGFSSATVVESQEELERVVGWGEDEFKSDVLVVFISSDGVELTETRIRGFLDPSVVRKNISVVTQAGWPVETIVRKVREEL